MSQQCKIKNDPPPSSSGLGRGPFKATTGVRIPVGAPFMENTADNLGGVFLLYNPV
jgi:hypothetical protein